MNYIFVHLLDNEMFTRPIIIDIITVLWDLSPRSLVDWYQFFGCTPFYHYNSVTVSPTDTRNFLVSGISET